MKETQNGGLLKMKLMKFRLESNWNYNRIISSIWYQK